MVSPDLHHVDAGDPYPAPPERFAGQPHCDLCGCDFPADEFSQLAYEASGYAICQQCIEEMTCSNVS